MQRLRTKISQLQSCNFTLPKTWNVCIISHDGTDIYENGLIN